MADAGVATAGAATGGPSEPPARAYWTELSKARDDLTALLRFITERSDVNLAALLELQNQKLPEAERIGYDELLASFVAINNKPLRELSAAEQHAVWRSLDFLTDAVRPVSLHSIRLIENYKEDIRRNRHRFLLFGSYRELGSMVRRLNVIGSIMLVVIVAMQIYALFGSSILGDIDGLKKQFEELRPQLLQEQTATGLGKLSEGVYIDYCTEHGTIPDDVKAEIERRGLLVDKSRLFASPKQRDLCDKLNDLNRQFDLNYQSLFAWSGVWFLLGDMWQGALNLLDPGVQPSGNGGEPSREQVSRAIIKAIQLYLLPSLYGFLGAFAHVYIRVHHKIETTTIVASDFLGYLTRLFLGSLLGFIAGLFFNPEGTLGRSTALSLAAFAFLMGYSAKLAVWLLEEAIGRITGAASQSRGPAKPAVPREIAGKSTA